MMVETGVTAKWFPPIVPKVTIVTKVTTVTVIPIVTAIPIVTTIPTDWFPFEKGILYKFESNRRFPFESLL